jgi:ubiquitin C-terminal hydrolase
MYTVISYFYLLYNSFLLIVESWLFSLSFLLQILYSLYGVVEHSGRLQGGHYTAFVKVPVREL